MGYMVILFHYSQKPYSIYLGGFEFNKNPASFVSGHRDAKPAGDVVVRIGRGLLKHCSHEEYVWGFPKSRCAILGGSL